MKIVWFIDNKFRELYGLHDLKQNLSKNNIKLYIFFLPIWKSALDFVNPNIIIVPNLYRASCEPIVNYAKKKNIDVFMHSSEGMFYTDEIQKSKYPDNLIKKIKKVLIWGKLDGKYLIKRGFKNKVVESGCLKFDERNYLEKNKEKKNKKIKTIGIPTHLRLITGSGISKNNIPYGIRKNLRQKNFLNLGYLKFEYEYVELISRIIEKIDKKFKIILKVSPFEDPEIYRYAFPELDIHKGNDVRYFLKNVDVILNVFSSISVDTLKYNVPVINLSKLVKWDEYVLKNKRFGPNAGSYLSATSLGIKVQNLDQLNNLLRKNKNYLLNLCKKKNFFKKANDLAGTFKTLEILTDLFVNYRKNCKHKPYNYFMYLKYFLVEIKLFFFGRPKPANFKRWKLSDQRLLYNFRISK
tara:strand:+ start:26196 stop:27425 length:1230 start_codon:yes stop_codon:yes gene_type:complete